jgi:hypothetical protein
MLDVIKMKKLARESRIIADNNFLITAVDSFASTEVIIRTLIAQIAEAPSSESIVISLLKAAKSKQWITLIAMLDALNHYLHKEFRKFPELKLKELLIVVLNNGSVEIFREFLKIGIYPKKILESIKTDLLKSSNKLKYKDKIKIIEECIRGKNLRGVKKLLRI